VKFTSVLEEIEVQFSSHLDLPRIVQELQETLAQILAMNPEVKKEFDLLVQGRSYTVEYTGVSIMILDPMGRKPCFRAKAQVQVDTIPLAWIELEYDSAGNVLDSYFDYV
jgi:hypothetical protein